MRGLDWPSSTAVSSGVRIAIGRAAEDPAAARARNRSPRASTRTARQRGRGLRHVDQGTGSCASASRRRAIALTGHAHIDLAWLWPLPRDSAARCAAPFHTALALMEQSSDFRFNQSTAHYYNQIAEDDPELLKRTSSA